MTADERRQKIRFAEVMFAGFYRCPTTRRIIEALPGDDKALCNCGRSNPKVPQEQTHRTGVHIVRFLDRATATEYVDEKARYSRP